MIRISKYVTVILLVLALGAGLGRFTAPPPAVPVHPHKVLHFGCDTCSRALINTIAAVHSELETKAAATKQTAQAK